MPRLVWFAPRQPLARASAIALMSWAVAIAPAQADPFRPNDPRAIDPQTETAFEQVFAEGNYPAARVTLDAAIAANSPDPLTYALRAALAYLDQDWDRVQQMADRTLSTARNLDDPLRRELYQGIAYALQGGYLISEGGQGPVQGAPEALALLPQANTALAAAAAMDPQDPELNLVQGYLALALSNVLPFGNVDSAIAPLQTSAPNYLAHRGLAVVYRRTRDYDRALAEIDQALALTPNNPELWYLRGQILQRWAEAQTPVNLPALDEAVNLFEQVLAVRDQLPEAAMDHLSKNELRRLRRSIDCYAGRLSGEVCDR